MIEFRMRKKNTIDISVTVNSDRLKNLFKRAKTVEKTNQWKVTDIDIHFFSGTTTAISIIYLFTYFGIL